MSGYNTPKEQGYSMPAEWEHHDQCWMAWPYRTDLWDDIDFTQTAYARVANSIRQFESVTMVVSPAELDNARKICGNEINYLQLEIDDSWTRDSGPSFLKDEQENLAALKKARDCSGRPFELVPIAEAVDAEQVGEIFCRSYINFYIANGGVVAPRYGMESDQRIAELLQHLFPDRKICMVDVNGIVDGGGGIHCITQQQPG